MTSPLKFSDFNPTTPLVLHLSHPSNRTSLITTTPYPVTERISCYLRHSLRGNIPVLVLMIDTYIQQTVLATKSSHIKVPSQVPLTDCLVFK